MVGSLTSRVKNGMPSWPFADVGVTILMRAEAELRIVHVNRLDLAKPIASSNWRITPS